MASSRPLRPRPGARFVCTGDGLCCTDVHMLGPVTRGELRALAGLLPAEALVRKQGMQMLRTNDDGGCVMLDARGCSLHATHGEHGKPRTCHRYPFLVAATPDGGRIGTDHRCPCRTMGARPVLTAEDAEPALLDGAGRLSVDLRIDTDVPLDDAHEVRWARWRAIEDTLFARLAHEEPISALDASPFPALDDGDWISTGLALASDVPRTRWGLMHAWFGRMVATLTGGPSFVPPERPWRDAFDRAEARSPELRDPREMQADFVADTAWILEWSFRASWARTRTELATRLAVADAIALHLGAHEGARADRAMAEALAIIEVAGISDAWTAVITSMIVPR